MLVGLDVWRTFFGTSKKDRGVFALPITLDADQDAIRQHERKKHSPKTGTAPASTEWWMCGAKSRSTLPSLG